MDNTPGGDKLYPAMSSWVYFLGSQIPLDAKSSYTIGRGRGCEIQLPDISVSREHARIIHDQNGFVVEDLGSTNGTFVNGESVSRQTLNSGDKIRVGRLHLEFQIREDGALPKRSIPAIRLSSKARSRGSPTKLMIPTSPGASPDSRSSYHAASGAFRNSRFGIT
jgi:pSer/pThr/pTyr-binding forkhead associated (FHA) protein